MRVGRSQVVCVCMFALALLAGCGQSETFRYKLTLNVEVDGRPRSASAVIEATQTMNVLCTPIESSYCYPRFSVKGVAPMIMLDDGGVIFASLSAASHEGEDGGQHTSVLPWLLYVDDWNLGPGKTMVELPPKPSRLELPLTNPKRKPTIWWVPPQPLGPAEAYMVGPSTARERSGRDIKLVSFVIEPTREPLIEWLEPAPPWMAAYRGGPTISKSTLDARRHRRFDPSKRYVHGSIGRSRLETSDRKQ